MTLFQIVALDRAGAQLARGSEANLEARMLAAARMSDRLHG